MKPTKKNTNNNPSIKPEPYSLTGKIGQVLNSKAFSLTLFFALLLIPIYIPFKYSLLPLQDLPNHLANVKILLNYSASSFYQQYFTISHFPYPYLLQDLLLSTFMGLGGPNFAASLFVALVAVSIPLSVLCLLKVVYPNKLYLSFLSLPFVWNILLYRGNLNYLLGLSIAIICIAILCKLLFTSAPNKKKLWISFGICLLLLYFAHLVAFLLFGLLSIVIVFYALPPKHKYRFLIGSVLIAAIALFAVFLAFGSQLPSYSFNNSISGKFGELSKVFTCLQSGDFYFLIPVFCLILSLILLGSYRIKEQTLPFAIIGILTILYFIVPYDLGPLIKAHERVFYLAVFLLPLCCIGQRYLLLEKITVIILCSITFLYSSRYFNTQIEGLSSYLGNARTVLQQIPSDKKLFSMRGSGPYIGHIDAYYVIDNGGYVPTLFSAPYMLVQYREKPDFAPEHDKINSVMIGNYDFVFVWGHNVNIKDFLNKINFTLVSTSGDFEVYENTILKN